MKILYAILGVVVATQLACSVNEYCLTCAKTDGGNGDGGGGDDARDGGPGHDGPDAGPCVPSGVEVCDGKDNDCNGMTDDGTLPDVGTLCANQTGECAGGVKQCVAGALSCTKPPMPEICDRKDNNCNGMADEGDPGGGNTCGTNVGECTAGVLHCNLSTGIVECMGSVGTVGGQPEMCNGRDEDCDGSFDEGLTNLGSCGSPAVGACHPGTMMCVGGGSICMNDQGPTFEACDNVDNDCDTRTDEDYNKQTDPRNCGTCNHICSAAHANSGCAMGQCTIASCQTGYHDNDHLIGTGCEYGPCQIDGTEVCDGVDNDCDGSVDNGLVPPQGLCRSIGACAGAVPTCSGAGGWRCTYSSSVSTDTNGNIVPETKCDDLDNDCDGRVDENQPNVDQACHDAAIGACQSTGTYQCDPSNLNGPARCVITMPGQMPSATEACNGKDDDCDGTVDESAVDGFVDVRNGTGTLLFQIYAYEASRPDASATSEGTITTRACSRPGVVPWASVTQQAAAAACAAIDPKAHLCTAADWQRACEGIAGTTYPYGNTYQRNTCNGNDYDPNCTAPDEDKVLATGTPNGCPTKPATSGCVSAAGAFDMSGNLKEWTATPVSGGAFEIRGGAYDSVQGGMTCDFDFVSATPDFTYANLGFRCCKSP